VIQLKKNGVISDRADVERLRAEFREKDCVRLRGLLEPQLAEFVLSAIARSKWDARARNGFDSEYVLEPGLVLDVFHFVANAPKFLEVVQEITGCGPFTWFGGRVYRMAPDVGHYDSWHTDNVDSRLIAMSVNLSPRGFRGGLFQMRRRHSDELLVEVANTGLGDAVLFRVSEDLVHRVTEIQGGEPRTAFVGWFDASSLSFASRLQRLADADRRTLGRGAQRLCSSS
jgi:hypothetical protein